MKSRFYSWAGLLCLFLACEAHATQRFVNVNNPSPASPYTSWATAATNIQDAADPAVFGDSILVTNGIYQTGGHYLDGSNRVQLASGVILKSVNGPAVTIIKGYQVPGTTNGASAIRCAYMMSGSSLFGFTLTGGATINGQYGGGVKCLPGSCVISNCIIAGNSAYSGGGGVLQGTVIDSVLSSNFSSVVSVSVGGGALQSTLINCLIVGNHSAYSAGAVSGCNMINCTVVGNSTGPGNSGNLTGSSPAVNSIFYYNSPDDAAGNFTNCCVAQTSFFLVNCFTNAPLFANLAAGDYHLTAPSPCINAGTNTFAPNISDPDGNARIVNGTVDVGAYEFPAPLHFVNLRNTGPVSPFTNWLTAATNIQDAVDVSVAGDFVVVSNGVYNFGGRVVYGTSSNRVVINKAITVLSVNGPSVTRIDANPAGTPTRCAYLTNGAVLSGFMLTNGYAFSPSGGDQVNDLSGGGIWCESTNATATNCIFIGGSAGAYGGGAYQGTLNNCVVTNNFASLGAGTYLANLNNCIVAANGKTGTGGGGGAVGGILNNCLIFRNAAPGSSAPGLGGGTYYSTVISCLVSNNTAGAGGGAFGGTISNSILCFNHSTSDGGGAYSNLLVNCILNDNTAHTFGGGAISSVLFNCTVSSNYVDYLQGMGIGGGVYNSKATNCIIYYNLASSDSNAMKSVLVNCCTTPMPTNGLGNITNAPLFVNVTNDFHMRSNSPCINAGNNTFVVSATDFDGNARIVGGTVDMGAYEYQSPGSTISYAYLQNYGLPTDGSVDNADADGDGFTTSQEWRAGTSPTDATSLLQMLTTSNSVSGATITWQSVARVTYLVQRGADMTAQPAFTTIKSNIVGQAGTTSYTDPNTAGAAQFFYRVGVQ